jgi:hypothetical protein
MHRHFLTSIQNYIHNNKAFLCGLLLLGVTHYISYTPQSILIGGDMFTPELAPKISTMHELSLHAVYQGMGANGALSHGSLVYRLVVFLLSWFIKNPFILRYVTVLLLYVAPYISFYYVAKKLTSAKTATILSLFYVLNIYSLITFYNPNYYIRLVQTVLPLVFWLCLQISGGNKKSLRNLVILLVVCGPVFANLGYTSVLLGMLLASLLIGFLACSPRPNYTFIIGAVVLILFSTSIWVLPSVFGYLFSSSGQGSSYQMLYSYRTQTFANSNTHLVDITKLLGPGLWGFKARVFGGYFFSFYDKLNSPFAQLVLLVPFFVYLYTLILPNNTKYSSYSLGLFVVLLIAVIFLKGPNEPFTYLYNYLFNNIPGFIIFRDPYSKIMLIIVFIISLAPCLLHVKSKVIEVGFLVYIFFMLTVVITTGMYRKTDLINDITQMQKVAEYINRDKSFYRVLELPIQPSDNIFRSYKNGYLGPSIYTYLLQQPLLDRSYNWDNAFTTQVLDEMSSSLNLSQPNLNHFQTLLDKYSVKYVIINAADYKNFKNKQIVGEVHKFSETVVIKRPISSSLVYILNSTKVRNSSYYSILIGYVIPVRVGDSKVVVDSYDDQAWIKKCINCKVGSLKKITQYPIITVLEKSGNGMLLLVYKPGLLFVVGAVLSLACILYTIYLVKREVIKTSDDSVGNS